MPCPGALGSDYFLRLGCTETKLFSVSPLSLSLSLSSLSSLSHCLQRSEYDPGRLLGTPKPLAYPRCPGQTQHTVSALAAKEQAHFLHPRSVTARALHGLAAATSLGSSRVIASCQRKGPAPLPLPSPDFEPSCQYSATMPRIWHISTLLPNFSQTGPGRRESEGIYSMYDGFFFPFSLWQEHFVAQSEPQNECFCSMH